MRREILEDHGWKIQEILGDHAIGLVGNTSSDYNFNQGSITMSRRHDSFVVASHTVTRVHLPLL